MNRVIAYVDGFNLYYGIREKHWKRFYWLNIQQLAERFLRPTQELIQVKYFTTVVKHPESKRLRQQTFLEALQTLPKIAIFYGHFLSDSVVCHNCGHTYITHHEKMTDVNISVELMKDAFQDKVDVAFVLSADSDLVGPVRGVRELFPKKRVVCIFPPGRFSSALKAASTGTLRIGHAELAASLFPDHVKKGPMTLHRPPSWT